jgi:Carboxypeptidase regulatory-like domain
MLRRKGRAILWATITGALLYVCGSTEALAQADRGTIQGLVTDASGAVVPNAKVQVIQTDTNSVTEVTTNGEGLYTVPNLARGGYRVVITKDGFAPAVSEGIDIRAGVQIRADLTLQPTGITEQVVVTASNLDTSAITNSSSLSQKLVTELPTIVSGTKRDITSLLQNLPGYTGGGTFTPRANGANAGDTEVFIDGGRSGQLIQRGALTEVGPSLEQVGEFSVVSNGFNAEYGGFGIWFSNVTIKSGTNKISGTVFDHYGSDALNARSFFQAAKSDYSQHEGGFTLGGPVVLPGYDGRNKTFFFASLGLFFSRAGSGGALITVPTPTFVRGDFSGLVDAQGRQIPIYDPATTRPDGRGGFMRDQFPGNIIPAERFSPAARAILQYVPQPDLAGNVNNFRDRKAPTWPFFDTYTPLGKVDHNLTSNQKLSVMYTRQIRHRLLWGNPGSGLGPTPEWGAAQTNPLDWITDQIANSWKLRINHDHVISPRMINHVTVSVDRYVNRGENKTVGQGWSGTMGISGVPADDGSFPAVQFQGGTAAPVNFGRAYDENWRDLGFSINENLTWTFGRHTMKFGGEIGRYGIDRFFTGGGAGTFVFSNFTTSQPNGGTAFSTQGNAFASFLLGEVFQTSALIPVEIALGFNRYSAFAQDEWRLTPRVTVSYGVRWDYQPPATEADDQLSSFVPTLTNPRAAGRPGALGFASNGGFGRNFQNSWLGGFGPRVGMGYSLNPKTMIRGSFGVYYNGTGNQTSITPLGFTSTPSFTSPDNFTPVFNWGTQPFPQSFTRPPSLDPSFANGQAVSYDEPSSGRLPQVTSWMAGAQREVGAGFTVELNYTGSRSTHLALPPANSQLNYVPLEYLSLGNLLLQPITSAAAQAAGFTEPFPGFANQLGANTVAQSLKPYPQYTSITSTGARLTEGRARYDSVQLRGNKRFADGLTLVSFLTWMKNESNTNYTPQYPGDLSLRIDPGTPPWVFGASWAYELPFGQDRRFFSSAPGIVSALISGWQFAGSVRYQTGAALSITTGNNLGPLGYGTKYADRVEGADVYKDPRKDFDPATGRYLDSAAFAVPGPFTLGNTGGPVDYVRGFTQKSESVSFSKQTPLGGGKRLVVGLDFINPFNFVRWNDPNTNISAGAQFGSVTGTQPGRTGQLNVSFAF